MRYYTPAFFLSAQGDTRFLAVNSTPPAALETSGLDLYTCSSTFTKLELIFSPESGLDFYQLLHHLGYRKSAYFKI